MTEFEATTVPFMEYEILADVEMVTEVAVEAKVGSVAANGVNGENQQLFLDLEEQEELQNRTTFVDHLKSPVVELVIGEGESQIRLTAHQDLLVQSPYFAEACAEFKENAEEKRINLPDENLDEVGCFLEYIYTGEYFPKKIGRDRGLAKDYTINGIDQTGEQLLKHARIYTLADKLGMAALKTLAHSKIHCIKSSVKGEIAYARYVYATTPKEDDTIRRPVASFWAHRSHVLRQDAEDEFREMCLEFPQFGFDVLTRVLDEKLRNETKERTIVAAGSSRKRQRQSQG